MSRSRFVIDTSKDGKYYFTLVASNNKVVAISEMYETKQACKDGIDTVKTIASGAVIEDKASPFRSW